MTNTNKLCSCWLPWIISYICSILLDIYLWQIENIMYCFLRISWTGFKRKHFKTLLNDYIISSFIRNRILHRAHLFGNTFIWYFLIGYICNLVNTALFRNRWIAKYLEEHWVQNFNSNSSVGLKLKHCIILRTSNQS